MRLFEIVEGEVVPFPGMEPKPEPQQISMLQAFGSDAMNILDEVLPNRSFMEKPSYFEDIGRDAKHVLTEFELHKLQKAFKNAGIVLPTYTPAELFHTNRPQGPMVNADVPKEKTFIIEFPSGEKYLADSTGARTYIRMWMAIQ